MRSIQTCLAAAVTALAVACGDGGGVEKAIKLRLKDPDSAKFQTIQINAKGNHACAVWNAKNSLGGYGEWQVSDLKLEGTEWHISGTQLGASMCTKEFYRLKDESIELTKKLLKDERIPPKHKVVLQRTLEVEYEDPDLLRQQVEMMRALVK